MKLFVIGATGRTGREIVQQALARGHDVTAFVRSPESITFRNERLTVLKGNTMDENQLFDPDHASRTCHRHDGTQEVREKFAGQKVEYPTSIAVDLKFRRLT